MKYAKAVAPAPTKEQLEKIKSEAIEPLDPYSSAPTLVALWHIGVRGTTALPRASAGSNRSVASPKWTAFGATGVPPVAAATSAVFPCVSHHRLAMVFHGGDCALCEEV